MDNHTKRAFLDLMKPTNLICEFVCAHPELKTVGRVFDCHDLYFIVEVNNDLSMYELIKYDRLLTVQVQLV